MNNLLIVTESDAPNMRKILIKTVYLFIITFGLICLTLSWAFSWTSLQSFKGVKNTQNEIIVCNIARNAVEIKIREDRIFEPPKELPNFLKKPAGVFVTIVKKGRVTGCMGTLQPREPDLSREIVRSAIMAATADLWHKNITVEELPELEYIVSIPGNMKRINSSVYLDPINLGLLVRRGKRSALLLPGEALTPEWQIYECKRKAGIPQNEQVEMFIFETIVFGPR